MIYIVFFNSPNHLPYNFVHTAGNPRDNLDTTIAAPMDRLTLTLPLMKGGRPLASRPGCGYGELKDSPTPQPGPLNMLLLQNTWSDVSVYDVFKWGEDGEMRRRSPAHSPRSRQIYRGRMWQAACHPGSKPHSWPRSHDLQGTTGSRILRGGGQINA